MPDPAYDEGFEAAQAGEEETANPYDPNDAPEAHTSWNDGWIQGANEISDPGEDDE